MGATPFNLSAYFLCVCVCFCSLCFVRCIFVFKNGWKFVHVMHFYDHTSLLNTSVQCRSLLQKVCVTSNNGVSRQQLPRNFVC